MIAILCPTRARPKLFKRMIDSALATANNPKNIGFYVAIRDEDRAVYTQEILHKVRHRHLMPDGMPTSHKWNALAEHAYKDGNTLFMLAADDIVFTTPCWDKALLEHYNGLGQKAHVYSFLDSRDAYGTPHPIITKEYIDAMGYFLPPIFLHWFVDSWTVSIAQANNAFTHLKDYLLVHDKSNDRGNGDETHNRIRRAGWRERDAYVNETCQHFLEYEKKRLGDYLRKREAA